MMPQTRLDRFEHRTEWPLAAVAIVFLALYSVQVLAAPGGRGGTVLPFLRPLRLLSLVVVINTLQRAVGHTIRGKVIVYTNLSPLTGAGRVIAVVLMIGGISRASRRDPPSDPSERRVHLW